MSVHEIIKRYVPLIEPIPAVEHNYHDTREIKGNRKEEYVAHY